MSQNSGTLVAAPIRPYDSLDTYPAFWASDGLGAYFPVADLVALNAIPSAHRIVGQKVYVIAQGSDYQLVGGITNSNWQVASGMGGPPTGPAGGDLTGTYPNPTVVSADGNFTVTGTFSSDAGDITSNGTGSLTLTGNALAAAFKCLTGAATPGTLTMASGTSSGGNAGNITTSGGTTGVGGTITTAASTTFNGGSLILNSNGSNAAGSINTQTGGSLTMGTGNLAGGNLSGTIVTTAGATMTGLLTLYGNPTNPNDAANKAYVDQLSQGIQWKLPVIAVATTNVTVSNPGTAVFDTITLTSGQRLGLVNQSTATENGIYIFNGSSSALTRSTDANTGTLLINATFNVSSGVTYAGDFFTVTTPGPITIGTTPLSIIAFVFGLGSVTSVAMTVPTGFSVSGSPITSTGTLNVTTTLSGIIKGTGSGFSSATSGVDYAPATSTSSILYGNGSGGFSGVTIGTGLSFSGGTLASTVVGGGTVTSITPAAGLTNTPGSAPSAITTSGTIYSYHPVNSQTGTTYTILNSDQEKLVTLNNSSSIAVALPQAGVSSQFLSGWKTTIKNQGVGTVTITPTTSTVDGGTSISILTGAGIEIFSDGTNYETFRGVGGAGSGTLTNFTAGNLSPIFTSSVATATTTPALTFSLTSTSQNFALIGPTSGSGAPSYRALVSGDIPALSYAPLPTGTASQLLANNGSGGLSNVTIGTGLSFTGGTLTSTGSGTVTSITPAAGLTNTPGSAGTAITSSGTIYSYTPVNAQTGTSYTILNTDQSKLITVSNASPVAITLPQAGASSLFLSGWSTIVSNIGAGLVTITPTTSTINGQANIILAQYTGVEIFSDGTNYETFSGVGGVSSVSSGNLSPIFTTSVATSTTTPAISYSLTSTSQNFFLAGPTSGSGAPSYRAIISADVPTLNQNTTGSAASFSGTLSGDVTGTQSATTVGKINGTSLAGLATGLLWNTTSTGIPSIASANMVANSLTGTTTTLNLSSATLTIPTLPVGQGGTGATTLTGILQGNGTSAFSPITVGSGLSFSGGTLTATGSGGTVTSITPGAGLTNTQGSAGSAITGSGTLYSYSPTNAQTGTSYTLLNTDQSKSVTFSNTSSVAVTLPQAGAGSAFLSGWSTTLTNLNTGVVTITPTTSTIDGLTSLALNQYGGIEIFSDGTNYHTFRGFSAFSNFTAGNLSPIFTTSVATSSTTPALTFSLTSTSQNFVLAGPTSGSGVPSYRALVSGDIPSLSGTYLPLAGGTMTGLTTTSLTTAGNEYIQFINLDGGTGTRSGYLAQNNDSFSAYLAINSHGHTGSGSINQADYALLISNSELAIGTAGNNSIHFFVDSGTTDAFQINTSSQLVVPAFSTAGVVTNNSSGVLASSATLSVSLGGTGASTLTGILQGNGTSAFSSITVGSGLSFSGGTLTATGSGGTVTSITPGAGSTNTPGSAPSAITSTGTIYSYYPINAQSGTSYTVANGDQEKLITLSNTSPVAVTLPQAGASSLFLSGWSARFSNLNTGIVTITPTTSTIDGLTSISLSEYGGIEIFSDGTNYKTLRGIATLTSMSSGNLSPLFTTSVATSTTTPALSFSLSNAAADSWFGNATGSSAAPSFNTSAIPAAIFPALTGDVTNSAGSLATTVGKINGTSLAGLASGLLYNTTSTGVPSIATANQIAAGLTGTSGTLNLSSATLTIPTLPVGQGGSGATTLTGILQGNGTSAFSAITVGSGLSFSGGTLSATGGGGSVTSFSAGNLSPIFTTSVATSTTTPALTFSLTTASANTVLAGPTSGSAAAPTYRALGSTDIPGETIYSQSGTTVNWSNGLIQERVLTANLTFTAFSNPTTGKAHELIFQASGGNYTVGLPTGSNHIAPAATVMVVSGDYLKMSATYDGTSYYWSFGINLIQL